MPFLPDTLTREVTSLKGSWDPSFIDATDVPLPNALLAQNTQYAPGSVGTRYGHSAVFTDSGATSGFSTFYNWLFEYQGFARNFLLSFASGVGLRITDNASPSPATLINDAVSWGASVFSVGVRAFVALFNNKGVGTSGGSVFGYPAAAFGFPGSVDPLFAGPMTTVPTITEYGTGVTTAGVHRFGFLLTTRNGFTTRWSPAPGDTFAPVSFTGTGGKHINFAITATWPTYADHIQVIMTTVANPSRYFIVPATITGVPAGISFGVNVDINISDDDLAGTAADASTYQTLLTRNVGGSAPFNPRVIFGYGSRVGYITTDASLFPVCYFSDPNQYQQITADQHGVYLPGNREIATGIQLRGNCYLFGRHWTYSTSDSGDVPATWATPALIDGSIGTISPFGVALNSSQNFAWVADIHGLYLFDGSVYPALPISYYNTPDWNRINWSVPARVRVVDDKGQKRVSVIAPLDGSSVPNFILTWDYTNGTTAQTVMYSLDSLAGYTLGAMEMVENPTTRRVERWFAPGNAGSYARQNIGTETNPYRDLAQPIGWTYQTSLFPGTDGQRGRLQMFHNVNTRAKGAGAVTMTPYSIDNQVAGAAKTLNVTPLPGKILQNRIYLKNEAMSLKYQQNATDQYCQLSGIEVAYTEAEMQR